MGPQNVRHLVNNTLRRPLAILFTSLPEKKSETNAAAILVFYIQGHRGEPLHQKTFAPRPGICDGPARRHCSEGDDFNP